MKKELAKAGYWRKIKMLKFDKKMSKLEKALQVEETDNNFYVLFNSDPNNIFFPQFCITSERPTPGHYAMMKSEKAAGPYQTIEEAREAILTYYQRNFPEIYSESLKRNSREALIQDGFRCDSWSNYKLLTNESLTKYMQEQKNFYKLPPQKQEEIREAEALRNCIREQRERVRILANPKEQRTSREILFLNNLTIEERHARTMSETDPFYSKILMRLKKAREQLQKETREVKK